MLRGLRDPNLLFTAIRRRGVGPENRRTTVAEFLLRNYTFDLSIRDEMGKNALILAAEKDMPKVVRLILEERQDLLNTQDKLGRTPLSYAAEKGVDSIEVLLSYNDIQLELLDHDDLAPIDYMLARWKATGFLFNEEMTRMPRIFAVMIGSLEHRSNRLDRHGCSLLHALIDNDFQASSRHLDVNSEHAKNILLHGDCKMLSYQEVWDIWGARRQSTLASGAWALSFRPAVASAYLPTAQIRYTSCKCGLGTIFLAISTTHVWLVKCLLYFHPDLVNDKLSDGSSPLDLASCIPDEQLRQSMIEVILTDASEREPGF